jgi:hypothetical protein
LHWRGLNFGFSFKGTQFQLAITGEKLMIFAKSVKKEKIIVHLCGVKTELPQGEWVTVKCN